MNYTTIDELINRKNSKQNKKTSPTQSVVDQAIQNLKKLNEKKQDISKALEDFLESLLPKEQETAPSKFTPHMKLYEKDGKAEVLLSDERGYQESVPPLGIVLIRAYSDTRIIGVVLPYVPKT